MSEQRLRSEVFHSQAIQQVQVRERQRAGFGCVRGGQQAIQILAPPVNRRWLTVNVTWDGQL